MKKNSNFGTVDPTIIVGTVDPTIIVVTVVLRIIVVVTAVPRRVG